ncbi:MAG TPA: hypothetical protein VGD21_00500 [Lysobacter sp.]
MSTPWSAEQREWLQALGHEAMVLAPMSALSAAGVTGRVADSDVAPPAPWPDGPLLRALARAAGRRATDAELARLLPDPATLRGNAAAKRALWPRLRALRRRANA